MRLRTRVARISAPPPRGRDALSVAAAALAPAPPAAPAPAPPPRASEPKPRAYEPPAAVRPVESRPASLSAAQGFRLAEQPLAQCLRLRARFLDARLPVPQALVAPLQRLELAVEVLFLLREPLLHARNLGTALAKLALKRLPFLQGLFLGAEQKFLLLRFGLSEYAAGLLLCLLQ